MFTEAQSAKSLATRQRNAAIRREIMIEEVRWLMSHGETPEIIARKLNSTPAALGKALYKAGERELGRNVRYYEPDPRRKS